MFREVRKKHRRLDKNESLVVLKEGMEGVISTIGEDGYPYGVAINYVYFNDAIYFHSSNKGHKLDNIRKNNKVSLFVSKDIRIIPEDFTTYYKSNDSRRRGKNKSTCGYWAKVLIGVYGKRNEKHR